MAKSDQHDYRTARHKESAETHSSAKRKEFKEVLNAFLAFG